MMFSIDNARMLSKLWIIFSSINVISVFVFFSVMLCRPGHVPICTLLIIIVIVVGVGFIPSLYVTFRAKFTSQYAFYAPLYFITTVEIMLTGSCAALAVAVSGRPDLGWLAFNTNMVCLLLTLLICVYLESHAMGRWNGTNNWREEIEKYIDYSVRQINPLLTNTYKPSVTFKHPFVITTAGSANIPLLFQIYGGGKVNAILLAAPVLTMTLAYMNYKILGPALTRLLLLRKIEKEVGYRFQNADYEKIQELRRGFFGARWLMKDYRPPQTKSASDDAEATKDNIARKKKRKRGK